MERDQEAGLSLIEETSPPILARLRAVRGARKPSDGAVAAQGVDGLPVHAQQFG